MFVPLLKRTGSRPGVFLILNLPDSEKWHAEHAFSSFVLYAAHSTIAVESMSSMLTLILKKMHRGQPVRIKSLGHRMNPFYHVSDLFFGRNDKRAHS
ncbi:hypothetical protein PMAYCL1PPCAC_18188 [Pristionchus mayeri]|uniref:Uncharacterized protein n=1 Tax=Pristionchus mayeri TaxID=1317129 RepID=A0AAN5CP42_9BILA|nr:hypothetical protein PMAYCL1PPCAC_18188 [Pristionchus mayeri]